MSVQPSSHYRQHHDVEAPRVDAREFRQGWRVSARLHGLLVDGLINDEAWQAAIDFRRDWDRAYGVGLGASGNLLPSQRSVNAGQFLHHRVDATSRLELLRRVIGGERYWLVEQCAVHDLAWVAIAMRLRVTDKTARTRTALAIRSLIQPTA